MKIEIPGEFARPAAVATRGENPPPGMRTRSGRRSCIEGKAWTSLADFTEKPKRLVFFATNRVVAAPGWWPQPGLGTKWARR